MGPPVHQRPAGRVVIGTPPLPADVARLVAQQRVADAAADARLAAHRWRWLRVDVVEGLGTFMFVNVTLVRGLGDLVLIALAGALVGLVWGLLCSSGIVSGLVAAVGQVVLCLVQVLVLESPSAGSWLYALLFGTACTALLGGFLGTRREQRAFG